MSFRFKCFDPQQGCLSPRLGLVFFDPLYQARQLLQDRSADEIRLAADLLEQIRRNPSFKHPESSLMTTPAMPVSLETGEIVEAWPAPNHVDALLHNVGCEKLKDLPRLRGLTWHELFAVQALLFIDEACVEETYLVSEDRPEWLRPTEAQCQDQAQEYAAWAKQAVSIAIRLRDEYTVQRTRTQRGGLKRQAASKSIKDAVITLYAQSYTSRSNRDAASRIVAAFEKEGRLRRDGPGNQIYFDGVRALNTDEPERRFEMWIGEYRRNRSA